MLREKALKDPAILETTFSTEARRFLDGYVEALRKHFGRRLERIVLFGSRAREDPDEDSDVDLLILLTDEVRYADKRWARERAWESEDSTGEPLSFRPMLMSISQFEHLRKQEESFARKIEAEGIPL